MPVSESFIEMLQEALSPLGRISARRMFSGAGIYCDGVIFGLVIGGDTLHLKADATTIPRFAAEGCGPFEYQGKGKTVATSYWRMPERLLDEPDEMVDWGRAALAIARKKVAAKTSAKAGRCAPFPR